MSSHPRTASSLLRAALVVSLVSSVTVAITAKKRAPQEPAAVPSTPHTFLAFRTPAGGASLQVGQTKTLGTIDVSPYRKIRVVVNEHADSPTGIQVTLTLTEGSEQIAPLDTIFVTRPLPIRMSPGSLSAIPASLLPSQSSRIYEVPGTTLTITATALGPGSGTDLIDLFIYGAD